MAQATVRPTLGRSMMAGLASGAIAAVISSLISLPLRSPDDAFFNTATVAIGSLALGLIAGVIWYGAHGSLMRLIVPLEGLFFLVVAGALAVDLPAGAPLKGAALFIIPLAVVTFLLVELLTPLFTRLRIALPVIAAPAVVAALVVGVALAGNGDARSGELALPDAPAGDGQSTGGGFAVADNGLIQPDDVAGVGFKIDQSQSEATYTVREKLSRLPLPNDAVGRTNVLDGTIFLDGRPSKIVIDLRTLKSDQPQRDNFIRTRGALPSDRYPFAEFTVSQLADLPSEYRLGETITRNVTGMMKIREVERPLTFATESRLTKEGLQIKGTTDFTWADFQIPPPNISGIVQVEDNVHLEVLVVAKPDNAS